MKTTKHEILAHLKRKGHASIEELARSLGLARMTVRQHLTNLERDGLVASREVRRPTGRPHFEYSLTDRGEETFPKRYDRLAGLLLEQVGQLEGEEITGLTPEGKKRLLFERMVSALLEEYGAKVDGRPLKERVAIVTRILADEGGFAEWRTVDGGFEISDYNCVYRQVAKQDHDLCDWHVALLGQLMGSDVDCTQFMSEGAACCRFVVKEDGAEMTGKGIRERSAG